MVYGYAYHMHIYDINVPATSASNRAESIAAGSVVAGYWSRPPGNDRTERVCACSWGCKRTSCECAVLACVQQQQHADGTDTTDEFLVTHNDHLRVAHYVMCLNVWSLRSKKL